MLEVGSEPRDDDRDLAQLRYANEGSGMVFSVDRTGRRVWHSWTGASKRRLPYVTTFLAGPVLGAVLRLHGGLSMHGSVVDVGGEAIVLVGEGGAGKSSLAAALADAGNAVVADDVAALTRRDDGRWFAHPGYPRLRLHPATLAALSHPPRDAGDVLPGDPKRFAVLDDDRAHGPWRSATEPRPVAAVYELRRAAGATRAAIEPLAGTAAVAALARHVRVGLDLEDPELRRRELPRLVALAGAVRVGRLVCPDGLDRLAETCRLLVDTGRAAA